MVSYFVGNYFQLAKIHTFYDSGTDIFNPFSFFSFPFSILNFFRIFATDY